MLTIDLGRSPPLDLYINSSRSLPLPLPVDVRCREQHLFFLAVTCAAPPPSPQLPPLLSYITFFTIPFQEIEISPATGNMAEEEEEEEGRENTLAAWNGATIQRIGYASYFENH